MMRDLDKLSKNNYDLLVVGGGIYGACVAWDAALRGLSTALVEKRDFGGGTSANSLKIIHGGFRYLQNADFKRMRESIHERMILMRIAPHLVHPLPVLVPIYGRLFKGKAVMALALFLNDLIGFDRNQMSDPSKYIPQSRVLSKEACAELLTGIDRKGLSGAALWYDAQAYNTERLTLSFILSASERGADVANYAEVIGLLKDGQKVIGARIKDVLKNDQFEVKAKLTLIVSGPWLHQFNRLINGSSNRKGSKFVKAVNLITRQIMPEYAFGISNKRESRDKSKNGSRFYFITPWRKYSIVGTDYEFFQGNPDDLRIKEANISHLLEQINFLYPVAKLRREDVYFYHIGLVPASSDSNINGKINLLRHARIYDYKRIFGVDGLVSVLGVKYTTARNVAERAVDLVFKKLGKKPPISLSGNVALCGGQIENFDEYLRNERKANSKRFKPELIERLVFNYGSDYKRILTYIDENPDLGQKLSGSTSILKAEVIHAVREEMAVKLADTVFRRTELGSAGHPGFENIKNCATFMAQELKWDRNRIEKEIEETLAHFIYSDEHSCPK